MKTTANKIRIIGFKNINERTISESGSILSFPLEPDIILQPTCVVCIWNFLT